MLVDLHNHLLPDVDDGSRTVSETLAHLRRFKAQGVGRVVLTPHLLADRLSRDDVGEVLALHRQRFAELRMAVRESRALYPKLALGQEILAPQPGDLDHVLGREDVGFNGGTTLLVEFGFQPGFDGDGVIERVSSSGRQIIVAHPERYHYGDDDPVAVATRWKESGALLQLNGGSVLELYSERAKEQGIRFLSEGLIDIIATDHHGDHRPHDPAMIRRLHTELLGEQVVASLMGAAPRALLAA